MEIVHMSTLGTCAVIERLPTCRVHSWCLCQCLCVCTPLWQMEDVFVFLLQQAQQWRENCSPLMIDEGKTIVLLWLMKGKTWFCCDYVTGTTSPPPPLSLFVCVLLWISATALRVQVQAFDTFDVYASVLPWCWVKKGMETDRVPDSAGIYIYIYIYT